MHRKLKIYYIVILFLLVNSKVASGVSDMNNDNEKISFTCVHEADHLPPLDPEADSWFKQARMLEKAEGAKNFSMIGLLYRQAIAKDHHKAMRNLQNLLLEGLVPPVPGKKASEEALEIVERMMKLNIPAGYYAMGYYLENGYGVEADRNASLAYFRKSADLGSPEGQSVIANILLYPKLLSGEINVAYSPEVGKSMLDCASMQGLADAAIKLARYYSGVEKKYQLAVKYLQYAVMNGSELAAYKFTKSFNNPAPTDALDYLDLQKDSERVHRYELIYNEIDKNPSARFPDLDKIVPLPPAPLPKWDGSFEYKKGGK
ncbi:MAG: DUF6396 domain-containing protein [Rouxiella aceris]|uniref:SEL1-like repeat protein n=1 Tax=Rouxiella aceris TaxID=2703884 RepID=UPI00284AF8A2|nr:DUF6396 domain-containing protein [Rouxiella aceris]MDR3433883.1 DUF6396 domain-containing protein [Rouxiella aceris]